MAKSRQPVVSQSSRQEIDAFIEQLNRAPAVVDHGRRGRILFALDATASRQPTWDHASHLQNEMFHQAASLGGLELKLCYFRGYNEFQQSRWLDNADALTRTMNQVHCAAGHTQIGNVLHLALSETRQQPVQAVIYIGDCLEEKLDPLCKKAGELGLLNTPVFLFQEGADPVAKRGMREIARLSGGAYHSFDGHSSGLLKQLLLAVAVYASGGRKALQHFAAGQGPSVNRLLEQLK
ncbi:VWA domain-containing protein [Neptuniibacter halophilus]|uniref:VWA domain-containing protein n=1 Tax=Neptuniibacter halophilus TaxID=651666 RepID=UPI0025737FB4|nr:VWA domain-containing protein [Neptuniibacter halophilus]